MKLNFWQILGLILVIVAIILIARRETAKKDAPPAPATLTS
jgi:drug/metabolite transporter (DMT)-like permease